MDFGQSTSPRIQCMSKHLEELLSTTTLQYLVVRYSFRYPESLIRVDFLLLGIHNALTMTIASQDMTMQAVSSTEHSVVKFSSTY